MARPGASFPSPSVGRRVRVRGVVQGVGYRPFVHGLASSLGLAGVVWNDGEGVVIEAQGPEAALAAFVEALRREAPPLARVEAIEQEDLPVRPRRGFRIAASKEGPRATAVSPDAATCAACLRELFDPGDRRHRYPFINCTNCGPRLSIVVDIPYDRQRTTMAGFVMCDACRREYEDPRDRRFHAQPNACPACGPRVDLVAPREEEGPSSVGPGPEDGDPIARAAGALRRGALVAVKGLGGYHLACRADDEAAVARLRAAKVREDKPFAVMVADIAAARRLVALDGAEERLLSAPAAPIVLASRRPGADVAPSVAPGHPDLGILLAYTPLHHLLLADMDGVPLVMTSGNRSDEPIAFRDDEALARLGPMVDLILTHDRPIRTRVEDSVARVVTIGDAQQPLMLRRSRGYVPGSLGLPHALAAAAVGCGAELKATFAPAVADTAWIGPHIGDLRDYEALRSYRDGIDHLGRLLSVEPVLAAHDLHPDYLSTREAAARYPRRLGVQHHHAHLAACLAEHREARPAIGAIFDGAGYGPDGTIWGGELLLGDARSFERVGHLWPVRQPGGDAAARQPWRMACAWLCEVEGRVPDLPARLAGDISPADWRTVARMALHGVRAPLTTSVGRLFDAVAALAGLRSEIAYEGQAAVELEAAARAAREDLPTYSLPLVDTPGGLILDARPTVAAAARDAAADAPAVVIGARFHGALAAATAAACGELARQHGVGVVVLSGGVFQNVRLLEGVASALLRDGLRVLVPEAVPPNDGGISYGQLAVASAAGPAEPPLVPQKTAGGRSGRSGRDVASGPDKGAPP